MNKDDEMVKVPYQQVVGSLIYTMLCTWLDLAYPISVVSHMANLNLKHWIIVKRIFQHLQGTLQFKLHYHPKIWSNIVMRIGPMTMRIGDPP